MWEHANCAIGKLPKYYVTVNAITRNIRDKNIIFIFPDSTQRNPLIP